MDISSLSAPTYSFSTTASAGLGRSSGGSSGSTSSTTSSSSSSSTTSTASTSSASTVEEINQRIKELQEQIADLQGEMIEGAASGSSSSSDSDSIQVQIQSLQAAITQLQVRRQQLQSDEKEKAEGKQSGTQAITSARDTEKSGQTSRIVSAENNTDNSGSNATGKRWSPYPSLDTTA